MKVHRKVWRGFSGIFLILFIILPVSCAKSQETNEAGSEEVTNSYENIRLYYYETREGSATRILMCVAGKRAGYEEIDSQTIILREAGNKVKGMEPLIKDGDNVNTQLVRFQRILLGMRMYGEEGESTLEKWQPKDEPVRKLQKQIGITDEKARDGKWGQGTWNAFFKYIDERVSKEDQPLKLGDNTVTIYRLDTILGNAPDSEEKDALRKLLESGSERSVTGDRSFLNRLENALASLSQVVESNDENAEAGGTAGGVSPRGANNNNSSQGGNAEQEEKGRGFPWKWFIIIAVIIVSVAACAIVVIVWRDYWRPKKQDYKSLLKQVNVLNSLIGQSEGNKSVANQIEEAGKLLSEIEERLEEIEEQINPQQGRKGKQQKGETKRLDRSTLDKPSGSFRMGDRAKGTFPRQTESSREPGLAQRIDEIKGRIGEPEGKHGEKKLSLFDNISTIQKDFAEIRGRLEKVIPELTARSIQTETVSRLSSSDMQDIAFQVASLLEHRIPNADSLADKIRNRLVSMPLEIEELDEIQEKLDQTKTAVDYGNRQISGLGDIRRNMREDLGEAMSQKLGALQSELAKGQEDLQESLARRFVNVMGGFLASMSAPGRKRGITSDRIDLDYQKVLQSDLSHFYRQRLAEMSLFGDDDESDRRSNIRRLWFFIEYWRLASPLRELSRILQGFQQQLLNKEQRLDLLRERFTLPEIGLSDAGDMLRSYKRLRRQIDQFKPVDVFVDERQLEEIRSFALTVVDDLYEKRMGSEEIIDGVVRLVYLRPIAISEGRTRFDEAFHVPVGPGASNRIYESATVERVVKRGYIDKRTGIVFRKANVIAAR